MIAQTDDKNQKKVNKIT